MPALLIVVAGIGIAIAVAKSHIVDILEHHAMVIFAEVVLHLIHQQGVATDNRIHQLGLATAIGAIDGQLLTFMENKVYRLGQTICRVAGHAIGDSYHYSTHIPFFFFKQLRTTDFTPAE